MMLLVTVDAVAKSANFMNIGCRKYVEQGGELERCQGLYTLERTWDEAAARCQSDGWTGLAVADTPDVETVVGKFMVSMNEEVDADNGYRAWISGHEVDDRVWKWNDGTTFQRQSAQSILHALALLLTGLQCTLLSVPPFRH